MLRRRIKVNAPAKVNLYLGVSTRVLNRFHAVDSIYHTVDLCDTLTFELYDGMPTSGVTVTCIPSLRVPQSDNLAYQAIYALAEALGREPVKAGQQLEVTIEKRIPPRAGLAGGSSDAAAALLACAALWHQDAQGDVCMQVASQLGSDVPFFLYGGCAYMTGKGDVLQRRYEPLDAAVVLINSGLGISTAQAYAAFDENPTFPESIQKMQIALAGSDEGRGRSSRRHNRVAAALHNNFEPTSRRLSPSVGAQLDWLMEQPLVQGATICGSGSACFAICESSVSAMSLAHQATDKGFKAWAQRLCSEGVTIVSDRSFGRR